MARLRFWLVYAVAGTAGVAILIDASSPYYPTLGGDLWLLLGIASVVVTLVTKLRRRTRRDLIGSAVVLTIAVVVSFVATQRWPLELRFRHSQSAFERAVLTAQSGALRPGAMLGTYELRDYRAFEDGGVSFVVTGAATKYAGFEYRPGGGMSQSRNAVKLDEQWSAVWYGSGWPYKPESGRHSFID